MPLSAAVFTRSPSPRAWRLPRRHRRLLPPIGTAAPAAGAAAGHKPKQPHKTEKAKAADRVSKETSAETPKGPLQIFISINQQKLHLYGNGVHVADTSIATGVPSHPTPFGVFSVIQKQVFHRSNIYSNA